MDAVKFLEENRRMCNLQESCRQCPISSFNNKYDLYCSSFGREHPEEAVAIVEQWSKEHPIITNWQKFQEVFGTTIDPVTAIVEWWSEEYKAPKGEE